MIDEQQKKVLIYFLLITNLVFLGTLFSTETIDYYQFSFIDMKQELLVRFDYWGQGFLRNNTIVQCVNYSNKYFDCRVIELCKYQAFFSIFITLLCLILQFLKSYARDFQIQCQLIIMISLLSGALNTILIAMFRQSIESDQILSKYPIKQTPGILEFIVAAQFTIILILQNKSFQSMKQKAINSSSID